MRTSRLDTRLEPQVPAGGRVAAAAGGRLGPAVRVGLIFLTAGTSLPCAGAELVDSLRVERISIHPVYTTSYRVFKAKRDWVQGFRINEGFGAATVNTSLDATVTRDEDQNDLELDANGIMGRVSYALAPGLDMGVLADFDRTSRLSRTSDLRSATELFRLTSTFDRVFADSVLSLSVDAEGGLRDTETKSTLRGGREGSRLETRQQGPSAEVSAALGNTGARGAPVVTYEVRVSADAFRQETDQLDQDLAADFTTVTASRDSTFKTTNTNRAGSVTLGFQPASALDFDVSVDRRLTKQVRPQPRQAALENTEGDDRSASLTALWKPWNDTDLTFGVRVQDSDRSSNLTTSSNRKQTGSGYDLDLGTKLLGVRIDASLAQSTQETDYRPLDAGSAQTDQSKDRLRTQVRAERALSKTITLHGTFDLSLDQSFFDDGILDVDRQDRTSDATITYKPAGGFSGRFSVTENRQRTVNLHPSRAGNTSTQERITVGAGYTYSIWDGLRVAQDISINAQSQTFDFDDVGRSELNRNNRLETTITTDVAPNTEITLDHTYNFRNSGRYAKEDGVRLFTLNREFAEQMFDVRVSYKPATWLTFRGEQSLRAVVNRSPGEEGTRTTLHELELYGELNRKLLDAVQTNLKVTRVLTTREDFYWRVDMSANRTF